MARKNINNIRYADDTIQMAESEKKSNSLLKLKEESEKAGLKRNIKKKKKKNKITASVTIASWQIDGEKMESDRFCFLGLQNHWGQ